MKFNVNGLILFLILFVLFLMPSYAQPYLQQSDINQDLDMTEAEQLKNQQLQDQLFKQCYNENKSFFKHYRGDILKKNNDINKQFIDGQRKYHQQISKQQMDENAYFQKYKLYNKDYDWYNYKEKNPDADYSYDDSYSEDYDDGSDVSTD